ncbi:MAG: thiamine pyrophosphate-requiring protein [Planctomycetota bacterium]|nr:MAG: thiamine pyrophosphate-requiring protein [Planctomycetota bacterium]
MTGAEIVADILKQEGVRQVFCFPYTPILEAVAEAGIRPIVARQERVAENMADGFSRTCLGKQFGVVTVQQAAGTENAFAGIAQAYTDSSPVLFLPGHPGRELVGVPPTFDAVRNFAAVTKWGDMIPSARSVSQRMRRAYTLLRSGRPGPVMLEIPVDVANEQADEPVDYSSPPTVRFAADADAVRDAVTLLRSAERPLVLAGQGVLYAGASMELTECAERLAAPVVTSMLGKSAINERHPLAVGPAALARTDMAAHWLETCDVIFAVGTSLTKGIFSPKIPPGKRFVHATVDARDVNKDYVADVPLLGDARLVLRQMNEELNRQQGAEEPGRSKPLKDEIASQRLAWRERWSRLRSSDETPLNPYRVMDEFMRIVDPADAIVTHDSGNPRDQLLPVYESVTPRGYLGWGHSTQLGFSLGATMGAKLAAPEKLAVNFMGDAAFGMVGMDVETAVREEIPILTMLLNNSAMGNYERNIPRSSELYGTKLLSGDYSRVAEGLGAFTRRVVKPGEIGPAIEAGIAATREGRPALLEFITKEEPEMAIG